MFKTSGREKVDKLKIAKLVQWKYVQIRIQNGFEVKHYA